MPKAQLAFRYTNLIVATDVTSVVNEDL